MTFCMFREYVESAEGSAGGIFFSVEMEHTSIGSVLDLWTYRVILI